MVYLDQIELGTSTYVKNLSNWIYIWIVMLIDINAPVINISGPKCCMRHQSCTILYVNVPVSKIQSATLIQNYQNDILKCAQFLAQCGN